MKGEANKLLVEFKPVDFVKSKGEFPDGLRTKEPSNAFKVFCRLLLSVLEECLPIADISVVFINDGEEMEDKNGTLTNGPDVG